MAATRATDVRLALALCALPVAGIVTEGAAAQEYQVDVGAPRDVRFISRASIEEFEGVTDRIDGYVLLGGAPLSLETGGPDTELYFEVDLASLDTGIGLRNRHMRDNYLEVRDHPYASFGGTITRVEALSGDGFRVTATGGMSIHGVERRMEIPCEVTPRGRGYRTRCSLEVLLSDFDIEIPRIMFLKLANEIRLELDFSVAPAGGDS
jgi:polyisoprenoid-binding protein YceI